MGGEIDYYEKVGTPGLKFLMVRYDKHLTFLNSYTFQVIFVLIDIIENVS